ncbi:hypothetical protein L873DRAFT_1725030, partial [Choiromyces venosus 120613-1]
MVQHSNLAIAPLSLVPPVVLNLPSPEFPLAFTTQIHCWKTLELGRMNVQCPGCKAFHWIDERSHPSTTAIPKFESCCKKGDVILESLPDPPDILKRLLSTEDADSKHFRKHIWEYNPALSFTSLKYSPDQRPAQLGSGIQCFQIHGELYHMQGPLNPLPDHQPRFAQLFLYDPQF